MNELVGKIFKTNYGGDVVVLEYVGCNKIKVKFMDDFGFEVYCRKDNLIRGKVWNPYFRNNYGVGYIGEIELPIVRNKSFQIWANMLKRCYSKMESANNSSYNECYVAEQWLSYTNFHSWFQENSIWCKEGYALDKDLLKSGNKCYSPNNCCFLPREVNVLLANISKSDNPKNHEMFGIMKTKSGRYMARYHKTRIGTYDTIEEASFNYFTHRASVLSQTILKFKDDIEPKALKALLALKDRIWLNIKDVGLEIVA